MEASQSSVPPISPPGGDEPDMPDHSADNAELQKLLDQGVITQEQYDEAVDKEVSVPPAGAPSNPTAPATPTSIPSIEQQQQIAQLDALNQAGVLTDDAHDSAKAQVLQPNAPTDAEVEEYLGQSRVPNLVEGTRVKVTAGPYAGRMAYVMAIHFIDGIQQMIAASGTSEARFATVQSYVLRTRDGRSDIFEAAPGEVSVLSNIEGWGRGEMNPA